MHIQFYWKCEKLWCYSIYYLSSLGLSNLRTNFGNFPFNWISSIYHIWIHYQVELSSKIILVGNENNNKSLKKLISINRLINRTREASIIRQILILCTCTWWDINTKKPLVKWKNPFLLSWISFARLLPLANLWLFMWYYNIYLTLSTHTRYYLLVLHFWKYSKRHRHHERAT